MTTASFRVVGSSDDLADGTVNPYYFEDTRHRVAVARVGDALYAFDDIHANCPLSAGLLEGATIKSQCDGSRFDLRSGAVVGGPAQDPLVTYEVRETDGSIEVAV
jgi:nitrite reductase/ring-hydroxylating ferredoxin subunit